jgi:tRNA(fMet)-specific endonuclease VapC
MICLDTNVVIATLSGRHPIVRNRLMAELNARPPIVMPVITFFEMRYGAAKSVRPDESIDVLNRFLALGIATLPFEAEDAEEAGDIRAALERTGRPIGPYDVLIAAQTRRRGAILVTANEREFARVPGLAIEDWSVPSG